MKNRSDRKRSFSSSLPWRKDVKPKHAEYPYFLKWCPVCCWSVPMRISDTNRQTFQGLACRPTLILTRQFLTAVEVSKRWIFPINRLQRGSTLFCPQNTYQKYHQKFTCKCSLFSLTFLLSIHPRAMHAIHASYSKSVWFIFCMWQYLSLFIRVSDWIYLSY